MRNIISFAAASLVTLAAGAASAEAPRSTAVFAGLPNGSIQIPASLTLPKSVAASERTPDFYVETPEYVKKNPEIQSRHAQIFATKEDAEARNRGEFRQPSVCFMSSTPQYNGEREVRWNGSMSSMTTVSPYPKSYNYGGASKEMNTVQAVRADRLIDGASGKVTLQSRVAFVDASTLGAKLASETKQEFALVREVPGRIRVYAAKSDNEVTFLVRRDRHPKERFSAGSMFVSTGQNAMSASDACHLTFTMPVKKGGAAMSVVQIEALLEVKDADVDSRVPMAMPVPVEGLPREGRMRGLQVGFSTSWMSQDEAPILSVSHGFTGRERIQPL